MPDWLDKEFIEKALRKDYGDDSLTVTDFNLSAVTAVGDNYMSDMKRATCQIERNGTAETIKLIVKTMPSSPYLVEMVEHLDCFDKEIRMLGKIIPAFHEILKATGEETSLAAKLYYSEMAPNPTIIMEDLSIDGFQTGDRCGGLNLSQCLQVMKSLATYHVASMVLLKNQPELKEGLEKGYWGYDCKEKTEIMYIDGIKKVVDLIDSWSDEKWSEQLKPLQAKVPKDLHAAFDEFTPGVPKVLSHGDLWTNNIMFKTLGNNQYDLRFVDLQLSSIRSPVIDILYFIFTSPSNEIRIREMNTLLQAYHQRWTQVCELLGEPNDFTYEAFLAEFKKKVIYGFAMLYGVHAVVSLPKGEKLELETKPTELQMVLYSNKHIKEAIVSAMPFFKSQGLF